MRCGGRLAIVSQADEDVGHHRQQDLADGVVERRKVAAEFKGDHSVDRTPQLGRNGFGILIGADATARHKTRTGVGEVGVSLLEVVDPALCC